MKRFKLFCHATLLKVSSSGHQPLQLFSSSPSSSSGPLFFPSHFELFYLHRRFHEWWLARWKFLESADLSQRLQASAPCPSTSSTRRSTWCSGSPLSSPPCSVWCKCCTRHSWWRLHSDPILSLTCPPLLWFLAR